MKGTGYLISIISVLLLAAVAWESTATNPVMRWVLVAGVAASIVGMSLRWAAYRREQRSS
ncbi:MAG TPA: hypothetical protein VGD10_00495 [Allosphingosinicella sp.]|uniref:hypothetical protein n=1 Tax=Allosphingosinicella sp. TaxID=2823234 RepID=UPI002EDA8C6B